MRHASMIWTGKSQDLFHTSSRKLPGGRSNSSCSHECFATVSFRTWLSSNASSPIIRRTYDGFSDRRPRSGPCSRFFSPQVSRSHLMLRRLLCRREAYPPARAGGGIGGRFTHIHHATRG